MAVGLPSISQATLPASTLHTPVGLRTLPKTRRASDIYISLSLDALDDTMVPSPVAKDNRVGDQLAAELQCLGHDLHASVTALPVRAVLPRLRANSASSP